MFYYYVTKVLPVEGDELHVGDTFHEGSLSNFNPNPGEISPPSGEIITIVAITEPTENGEREEFDLIITRTVGINNE